MAYCSRSHRLLILTIRYLSCVTFVKIRLYVPHPTDHTAVCASLRGRERDSHSAAWGSPPAKALLSHGVVMPLFEGCTRPLSTLDPILAQLLLGLLAHERL